MGMSVRKGTENKLVGSQLNLFVVAVLIWEFMFLQGRMTPAPACRPLCFFPERTVRRN